ncbi:MAG: energy-coupling factor transporter transmembrane component T family protein [Promethearchaeia archaeon]
MAMEYVPGDSLLHRMDPRTKIFIFLCLVVLTVVVFDPIVFFFILLFTLGMYHVTGIPRDKLMIVLKASLPAMILFIIVNYLTVPPQPGDYIYFYLIPYTKFGPVTFRTTLVGISSGERFIFFIIVTRLITLVTPVSDLLIALVKLRFPVEVAVSLGIAFASVPLMINQFRTVIEAQKSRGAKFDIRNPITKMRAYVPVIVPSIYLTVLRGIDISRTIESRAFTYNPANRTFRHEIAFQGLDYGILALALLLTIGTVILSVFYGWFDYPFLYNLMRGNIIQWIIDLFGWIINFIVSHVSRFLGLLGINI